MDWESEDRGERQVNEIARALRGARRLFLATDPDREGEAISWHVREMLARKGALKGVEVHRITFNEITKRAVQHAIAHPRDLDTPLIDAYLARRALDYLVGFTLSPVLWRKLPGSRSAGRVQSVALRLICEREAEIEAFRAREYWTVEGRFTTPQGAPFTARLTHLEGRKLEQFDLPDEAAATARQGGGGGGRVQRPLGREAARPAQPAAALHHLHLAAGGLAQARPRRAADHARRAAALRGRGHRGRDGRPHHLHADGRRADGARGDHRHPRPCERRVRRRLPAGRAARVHLQGQERPGGARGDPPDRRARTRRRASPASSTTGSAASTSWSGSAPSPARCSRPSWTRPRWTSPTRPAASGCAPPAR